MPRTLYTRGEYPSNWDEIARNRKEAAGWKCIRCRHPDDREAGYALTVHHFDGDKDNCKWWNLLALCQRCHLRFQARVNPEQPYMFEHSEWLKPYVAGFYAKKYGRVDITRTQALENLDHLLAWERLA